MKDKIVFWVVLVTAMPTLFFHAGYEAGKTKTQATERVVYLTGKTDPLCQRVRKL